MKPSTFSRVLFPLEGGLAFALAGLCVYHILDSRELNRQAWVLSQAQQRQQALMALSAESVEYSRQNPAIDPLLVSLRLKPGAPSPSSTPSSR
jgi:hypothetical protein